MTLAPPTGDFVRLQWFGQISATDTWSAGCWYQLNSAPSQSQLDSTTSNARDSFNSTFWTASSSPWKTNCAAATTYVGARAYHYHNGVLTTQSQQTMTAVVGTGTNVMPAYCAVVFTLLTAGFGRSKRGRMYIPMTANGLMLTDLQTNPVQAQVDNLRTVIAAPFHSPDPVTGLTVVLSMTHGFATPITSLRVDSIPDTQRGRQSTATALRQKTSSLTQ